MLLGSSLIWTGVGAASGPTLLFAAIVLFARPMIYLAALAPTRIDWPTRWWVAWFGPRGLSSLLLVLLAVFAGMPEGGEIFRVACLVVLLSILLHGGTLIWIGRRGPIGRSPELIEIDELRALLADGAPVRPIDVRREAAWAESDEQARGALRLSPDRVVADARVHGLPTDAWLVLYCT